MSDTPTNPAEPILSTTKGAHRIGIITCSTRPERINPIISAFVLSTLQSTLPPAATTAPITFIPIDLATQPAQLLSLTPSCSEPLVPASLDKSDPTTHYTHATTRAWSALIASLDAYIFVTPQYNWSMPASVKAVIDLLFHEWDGKLGLVVSYGGHGGGRARRALEQVLIAVRVEVVGGGEVVGKEIVQVEGRGVELRVPLAVGKECMEKGELVGGLVEGWRKEGMVERLEASFEDLVGRLEDPAKRKGPGH